MQGIKDLCNSFPKALMNTGFHAIKGRPEFITGRVLPSVCR